MIPKRSPKTSHSPSKGKLPSGKESKEQEATKEEKDEDTEKDPLIKQAIPVIRHPLESEDSTEEESDVAVSITNGSFCWSEDSDDLVLKDINFEAKVGE